jgi:hypothetical protein
LTCELKGGGNGFFTLELDVSDAAKKKKKKDLLAL